MRGGRATLSSLTTSWMESGTPSEGIGDPGGGREACRGLAGPHHERRAHLASAPLADADFGKDRRRGRSGVGRCCDVCAEATRDAGARRPDYRPYLAQLHLDPLQHAVIERYFGAATTISVWGRPRFGNQRPSR
jgi:hypothetical protein